MTELIQGDCLIESDKIESGSVDLILTDLPYGTVKNIAQTEGIEHGMKGKLNWDDTIDSLKIFEIANRILRKNGKMVLFAQQPFTNELMNKAIPNIPFSYSMIWEKDHFANALTAKKAPLNYYEDVLVFSKMNPIHDSEFTHPLRPYFKLVFEYIGHTKKTIIDRIGQRADHTFRFNSSQFSLCTKEAYEDIIYNFCIDKMDGFMLFDKLAEIDRPFKSKLNDDCNNINPATFNLWEGNKYKSNILKYKKDYNGFHPTQKPILLLEDLIKTFSNENDLVVDLTMGSGSTGVAAKNTSRSFIGIEKDPNYFKIAKERINKTDLFTLDTK
jgi:site-specific DNA-methyltransferase (adenine-specific)